MLLRKIEKNVDFFVQLLYLEVSLIIIIIVIIIIIIIVIIIII